MPVSQETAARADHPVNTPIYDKDAYIPNQQLVSEPGSLEGDLSESTSQQHQGSGQPDLPSETVRPGVADDATQQGATQPGSGSAVPSSAAGTGGSAAGHQPTFKEKVVGYAKKTRGATLGKTETKEQGERILAGQEVFEPKKVGPGARKDRSGSL